MKLKKLKKDFKTSIRIIGKGHQRKKYIPSKFEKRLNLIKKGLDEGLGYK